MVTYIRPSTIESKPFRSRYMVEISIVRPPAALRTVGFSPIGDRTMRTPNPTLKIAITQIKAAMKVTIAGRFAAVVEVILPP
jgi:hypothetical protein